MRKVIKYKELSLTDKTYLICSLRKIQLSDSESATMAKLITYSSNNAVTLDVNLARQIREELNFGQSLFNTCINRLEKKKCIRKEGKSIWLDPMFNNLQEVSEIVIKIE